MYSDHPSDPKIVAVVDRWSLLRGHLCNDKSQIWDLKKVVVIDMWLLFVGNRLLRFEKILEKNPTLE